MITDQTNDVLYDYDEIAEVESAAVNRGGITTAAADVNILTIINRGGSI